MSIWWSEFQAARKSWRCWLVDTPTPPAIISPSSGPDKDLDITDGVESWECSVFTVWPVVLAELSWAAEQDKNNPPVPVSVSVSLYVPCPLDNAWYIAALLYLLLRCWQSGDKAAQCQQAFLCLRIAGDFFWGRLELSRAVAGQNMIILIILYHHRQCKHVILHLWLPTGRGEIKKINSGSEYKRKLRLRYLFCFF